MVIRGAIANSSILIYEWVPTEGQQLEGSWPENLALIHWCCYCPVSKLCLILRPHEVQHTSLPCPSLSLWVCSNPCPLSQWCHPTIWSSVIPFSSCLQSFPSSGSFPMSRLLALGVQDIGALSSASVLPMHIQGWFPLGWTGLISMLSKGLSRVFSSTTVWKHKFFSAQSSLWSNSHIHTWLLEKP